MMRLVLFILFCAIFLVFIVFNLNNNSDISFGFKTLQEIPVYLTAFSSFVLGMLFAVPFVLSFGRRRKKPGQTDSSDSSPSSEGLKKLFGRKNKNNPDANQNGADGAASLPAEIKKEDGPYGIN